MASDGSDETFQVVFGIGRVLNIVSAFSSMLVLVILGVLAFHNYRLVNRISLRLTAGIAVVDIVNHPPRGGLCVVSGMIRLAGRQMYCFLNIAIAVNLQLIFINGLRPRGWWEAYYWLVPTLLVLLLNVPPMGIFGHNGSRCFINSAADGYERTFLTVNLTGVMVGTFVYCCAITLIVTVRLRSKLRIVQNLDPHGYRRDAEVGSVERSLKQLIFRITLYPITFVISMFFYVVVNILYLLDVYDDTIVMLSLISLTLTGTLGLVAFFLDPTLHVASKAFFSHVLRAKRRDISVKFGSALNSNVELSRAPFTYNQFDQTPDRHPEVGGQQSLPDATFSLSPWPPKLAVTTIFASSRCDLFPRPSLGTARPYTI
ncbi:hypothetical protein L0F63_003309 [Massospora cicadina]|nr:hypothetical protein L0F63_003309 [Massospora cicadina]